MGGVGVFHSARNRVGQRADVSCKQKPDKQVRATLICRARIIRVVSLHRGRSSSQSSVDAPSLDLREVGIEPRHSVAYQGTP